MLDGRVALSRGLRFTDRRGLEPPPPARPPRRPVRSSAAVRTVRLHSHPVRGRQESASQQRSVSCLHLPRDYRGLDVVNARTGRAGDVGGRAGPSLPLRALHPGKQAENARVDRFRASAPRAVLNVSARRRQRPPRLTARSTRAQGVFRTMGLKNTRAFAEHKQRVEPHQHDGPAPHA